MPKFNPDPIGQPTFRPQFPLRVEDFRRLAEQAQQGMRGAVTGDENDMGAAVGHQGGSELAPQGFWARIYAPPTDLTKPLYSFIEVQDDGTGYGWTVPNGALRGIASAQELNNTTVPVPGPPLNLTATARSKRPAAS